MPSGKTSAEVSRSKGLLFRDANVFIGRPMLKGAYPPITDADALRSQMRTSGIVGALVWHTAQADGSAEEGNRLLSQAIREEEGLNGCWAVLPPGVDDLIGRDFFQQMKANRIAALCAFPDSHRYFLSRIVFGAFFDEVAERRIPVLLSLEHGVTWPAVYAFLGDYPKLTCILCDIGGWSADRYTYPLLAAYPNVHAESSMLSLEDGGVEAMAARFGSERIVFGTGLPKRYAEAAMLQLAHAALPEADKRRIAGENLERLITGVTL